MKFRSKPIEIEATCLSPEMVETFLRSGQAPKGLTILTDRPGSLVAQGFRCHSMQGNVKAHLGDWIIQESDGSGCYPCHPDVFAAKYEPVA